MGTSTETRVNPHKLGESGVAGSNGVHALLPPAAQRFEELFQGLPVACYSYDLDGRILEWNRACETLFGLSAEHVLEMPVWQALVSPAEAARTREAVARVLGGERLEGLEWEVEHADGPLCSVLCSTFPLHGPDGKIIGGISANVDITLRKRYESQIHAQAAQIREYNRALEQQKAELESANRQLEAANAQLEALATLDGLTGLKNYRAFQEKLQEEFERALRYQTALSLLLLDVDQFKLYNDSFGHPAGDAALKAVAGLLLNAARETDFVARYGGEEFVVILPHADAAEAEAAAERFRAAIEGAAWPRHPVTASVGVASTTPLMPHRALLVSAADRALYHAKERGRNRVAHARDLPALAAAI